MPGHFNGAIAPPAPQPQPGPTAAAPSHYGPGFGPPATNANPRSDVVTDSSPTGAAFTTLADALARAAQYGRPVTTSQYVKYE
jgi:hypothetical protein